MKNPEKDLEGFGAFCDILANRKDFSEAVEILEEGKV